MLTARFSALRVAFATLSGLSLIVAFSQPARAQVLVTEFSSGGGISEYTFGGVFVRTFVAGGSGGLNTPSNLKFGPDGNLYVASSGNGSIKKYDGLTGAFLGNVTTSLGTPYDLIFGADGNLYVPDYNTNSAYKINPATGAILQTYTSGITRPEGIDLRANGNLIVTGNSSNPVEINSVTGTSTVFATGIGVNVGSTVGPDSRFYFSGYSDGNIDVVPAAGGAATTFSSGGSLAHPQYIAYGNGSFYVGSISNSTVQFFNATTGAFQGSFASPAATGIAIRSSAAAPEPGSFAFLMLPGFLAAGRIALRRRSA